MPSAARIPAAPSRTQQRNSSSPSGQSGGAGEPAVARAANSTGRLWSVTSPTAVRPYALNGPVA